KKLSHSYIRLNRHAWAQQPILIEVRFIVAIEVDADRNTLYYLNVVSGSILRRQQAVLGAGCAADAGNMARPLAATVSVNFDVDRLTRVHVVELGLFKVGRDPHIAQWNNRQQVLA